MNAGAVIDAAVEQVLADPGTRTRDLGGALGTDAFGNEVAAAVASKKQGRDPRP